MATARAQRSKDVDAYLKAFPKGRQAALRKVRDAIRKAVPAAEESVSYGIPYYKFHGRMLYFAGFHGHYSVYGVGRGLEEAFSKDLARYGKSGRGTIRFPYDEPVPVRLIARMAKHRAKENLAQKAAKAR